MTDPLPSATCPDCGSPLPPESPQALCPACLMRQALASRTIIHDGDKLPQLPPTSPEEIADKFPGYEILECLGRGGMGVVYKARQKSLNRLVAIKILAPERVDDSRFAERFTIEAELLAKLSHPHIVTIHDFGETGGLFYLVMEFIDGVNLRDLLRDGKLEPAQALAIVPPICDALQYAHDKGIVHRDIKPENLLLDRDGRIKIADFGIAKLIEPLAVPQLRDRTSPKESQQSDATIAAGTLGYSAPEQTSDPQHVDQRADIYSLGVVLYEMLTGERPNKDLVAPSKKVQIDVRLDEIVLRALEKTPELRYQTAGEFRTVLETVVSEMGSETAPNPPMIPFAGFWRRCWALLIDAALVSSIVSALCAVLPIHELSNDIKGNISTFILASYWMVMESSRYQASVGKMILGIRVVDGHGRRLTIVRACGRNASKLLSLLTFSIGFMMAGWTRNKQALHDMMAGCFVVRATVLPTPTATRFTPTPARQPPMLKKKDVFALLLIRAMYALAVYMTALPVIVLAIDPGDHNHLGRFWVSWLLALGIALVGKLLSWLMKPMSGSKGGAVTDGAATKPEIATHEIGLAPAIIAIVMHSAVLLLVVSTLVILPPKYARQFAGMEANLPAITHQIFNFSESMGDWWPVLIVVMVCIDVLIGLGLSQTRRRAYFWGWAVGVVMALGATVLFCLTILHQTQREIMQQVGSVTTAPPTLTEQPVQPPENPAWGAPDQGVSVRLRADKAQWTSGEIPSLKMDMRNQGNLDLTSLQSQEFGRLEVDGVAYRWTGACRLSLSPFPPGRVYTDIPVTLGMEWMQARDRVEATPPQSLRLAPGRHVVRFEPVMRVPGAAKGGMGPSISCISNPVEIEIITNNDPSTVIPMAWGEPVNGVAVHLQADLTAWTTDEFPVMAAHVRNNGASALPLSIGPTGNELEVDGKWYEWQPENKDMPRNSMLAPGAECAIPLTFSSGWQSQSVPLSLGVGQHVIRFAIRAKVADGKEAVRIISNPIRLDIADGIAMRAALVARYLPGHQFRSVRTEPAGLEEVLLAPDGSKVNLAEMRKAWWSFPNPDLTAFIRPLRLKITTAAEAQDITRIVVTVLSGGGNMEGWEFRAKSSPTGWHVEMVYVGPPAQIPELRPIELILQDGLLVDVANVEIKPAPMIMHVSIAADGALTVAGEPCPPDQLADRIKKLAGQESVSIKIHADKKTPYRKVRAVLDACAAAGIKDIAFSAEKP